MGAFVDQLVAAGYGGYTGWGDAEARADFNATGGSGKFTFNTGGGGGGGGYTPISAPDLAKLREQVYGAVNPYYQELAKQSKGDFDLAIKMMTADYQQGVKEAKENLAFTQKYGKSELQNALDTLGLNFTRENEAIQDTLNKRGMAVYQNNPNGTPNVVTGANYNPSYDANAYTYNAGVSGQSPNLANLGRGGVEAERLRQDQSLRAEATMRAGMKPLEQAGISFKQFTNPNTGFNPANPAASTQGADLSQLGSSELGALKGYNTQTQKYRDTAQELANRQAQEVNNLASQYAGLGVRSIDTNLQNQIQKQYKTDFIQGGIL